jgi:DNA-binding winged helix-turn-helix (wHTH) protein/tetratricopeptide (TPR) repeat protein
MPVTFCERGDARLPEVVHENGSTKGHRGTGSPVHRSDMHTIERGDMTPGRDKTTLQLEPFTGRLSLNGRETILSPKSAQILDCLLRSPGTVVTRRQLFAEAWPDQIVSDAALTQAMSLLRRELGETLKHCIRTIPKRGYAFDLGHIDADAALPGAPRACGPVATDPEARAARESHVRQERTAPLFRRRARHLLALSLAVCAASLLLSGFLRESPRARSDYALTISESAKTGLANATASLLDGEIGRTGAINPHCTRTDGASRRDNTVRIFLDTAGFKANPLSEIPYWICLRRNGTSEAFRGQSTIDRLYSIIGDAYGKHDADIAEPGRNPAATVSLQAADAYSTARELVANGQLYEATRAFETAFRNAPHRPGIAMEYAKSLVAIGEITKARMIYGSVISSRFSTSKERSLASVELAEIEGRFADAARLMQRMPIEDGTAARRFDNYYRSLDPDGATAFVSAARNARISAATARYLEARLLAWKGQVDASSALLSSALATASEDLHSDIVEAMVANQYAMFRERPDRRFLDRADSLLKDLEIFHSRRQDYTRQLRVRQSSLVMALPFSDACRLHADSDDLLQRARRTGAPMLMVRALHIRSWVRYRCGDLRGSGLDLREALDIMRHSSDYRRTATLRIDYAYILMSSRHLGDARAQLDAIAAPGLDEDIRDSVAATRSRLDRLAGNRIGAMHPCQSMLSMKDDRARRRLVAECVGAGKVDERAPEPSRFHAFMQSVHGVLAAARCNPERCVLPQARAWADEIRASEPTPRQMMREDLEFACDALRGMCDSPEMKSVLFDLARRSRRQ